MSLLELEELLLQLGQRQSAEICRHYQISETRLKRAKYRVKAKFAQKLLLEE
ncbi:hypothetical protein lacNasYZ03_02730 [Lactobacillus nasalidis]|uniref:RNA polymerase sigma-70 region 4 domain-containing protein n=1 Tax=Lactobacillus nasalidis TaxID=2797258 RepID=A0ABQ3W2P9_9LACO|nr:hypothetical protein lacNasYZ03_02730 [Lactobacillus nasalidis]